MVVLSLSSSSSSSSSSDLLDAGVDAVLYAQIVNLETQRFLLVEFNRLIVPKFVKS